VETLKAPGIGEKGTKTRGRVRSDSQIGRGKKKKPFKVRTRGE